MNDQAKKNLRTVINENLRIQQSGATTVPYVDVSNAATDILTRQNHAIFGRRGCGKSLLLHHSTRAVPPEIKTIYLNCEDFKNHSFPNVLIEILDSIFSELERHVSWWFGRKQKCKALLKDIRKHLDNMKSKADEVSEKIRESTSTEHKTDLSSEGSLFDEMINLTAQIAPQPGQQ